MAKLPRVTGKVFASNAAAEDIGQYGSALTGTKVTTSDIEQIQALSAYETGWRGAVISDRNYPTLQEMNGLQKTFSQQICYTLQEGIPEWDAGTTYYKGSVVKSYDNGTLNMYYSISDDNINNEITNTDYWQEITFSGGADTDLSNLSDAGMDIIRACTDGLYTPVDLTEKFADEIAQYGDAWTWIHNRIQNVNYSGIHIGDYIPLTLTGGTIGGELTISANQAHKMQVAGIDTYYNWGDTTIPHHIDFLSLNTVGGTCQWNAGNSNNGTSSQNVPYLACKVYAICNGVNNASTSAYNSLSHGLNCSSGGILQMLPESCQNYIIEKRMWAACRYSSSALINYPASSGSSVNQVFDGGKVWVPHEVEICAYQPNSYNRTNTSGADLDNIDRGMNVQYPLFRQQSRVKTSADDGVTRQSYWLNCPSGKEGVSAVLVNTGGIVNMYLTSSSYSLCFGFRVT